MNTRALAASSLLALAAACQAPKAPVTFKGEPVCKDLVQASEKVKGGLKKPVQMRILEDGDEVAVVMLYGIPESSIQPTRFLLPDATETYTLEFAQCPNERAPTKADPRDRTAMQNEGSRYECGKAEVYEKVEHTIRKGDQASKEIDWVAPPDPGCW